MLLLMAQAQRLMFQSSLSDLLAGQISQILFVGFLTCKTEVIVIEKSLLLFESTALLHTNLVHDKHPEKKYERIDMTNS